MLIFEPILALSFLFPLFEFHLFSLKLKIFEKLNPTQNYLFFGMSEAQNSVEGFYSTNP